MSNKKSSKTTKEKAKMKKSSKHAKPYGEMNQHELAEATKEFDQELQPDTFHSLGPEKQAIWARLQELPDTNGACPEDKYTKGRVRSQGDLQRVRERVKKSAQACLKRLKKLTRMDPMQVLAHFKFAAGFV